MKVITTISVRLERPDGTSTTVEDVRVKSAGDSPSWEAREARRALDLHAADFPLASTP